MQKYDTERLIKVMPVYKERIIADESFENYCMYCRHLQSIDDVHYYDDGSCHARITCSSPYKGQHWKTMTTFAGKTVTFCYFYYRRSDG